MKKSKPKTTKKLCALCGTFCSSWQICVSIQRYGKENMAVIFDGNGVTITKFVSPSSGTKESIVEITTDNGHVQLTKEQVLSALPALREFIGIGERTDNDDVVTLY